MLRMCCEYKTQNDDLFVKVLRDFVHEYGGKAASTADFQRVLERDSRPATGAGISTPWIYGGNIPCVPLELPTSREPRAGYDVTVSVRSPRRPGRLHDHQFPSASTSTAAPPLTSTSSTNPGQGEHHQEGAGKKANQEERRSSRPIIHCSPDVRRRLKSSADETVPITPRLPRHSLARLSPRRRTRRKPPPNRKRPIRTTASSPEFFHESR